MTNKPETLYGLRVISWKQENSNYGFGDFEGIIICKSPIFKLTYELIKLSNHELIAEISLPFDEINKNYKTSGKAFADYLIAEAKKLRTIDEEIVFGDNIVLELQYKDEAYERFKKVCAVNAKNNKNSSIAR